MKRSFSIYCFFIFAFLWSHSQPVSPLEVEDLWGNRYDFSDIARSPGTVLVQPFSSSNCGYCLIDGWFVKKNYFETNRIYGGSNYYQCLFNPQRDVYSFIKHYRDEEVPVLVYPPALHSFHEDGFPAILAFRNGEQLFRLPRGYLSPYDVSFDSLRNILWPGMQPAMRPTSDLHMATRVIYENENFTSVCVVPDGDTAGYRRNLEFGKKIRCYTVKYLSGLTSADRTSNLYFTGRFTGGFNYLFHYLKHPVGIENDSSLVIGEYRFPMDRTGFSACFPNPFNTEKYIVFNILGNKVRRRFYENAVDFTVYTDLPGEKGSQVLLHGFFSKTEGDAWKYADSLSVAGVNLQKFCVGVCKAPVRRILKSHERRIDVGAAKPSAFGPVTTVDQNKCRFPSVTTDRSGICWVAWEKDGDILLSSVNKPGMQTSTVIEGDASGSFDPLVACYRNRVWVFYLNDQDGFYRLYGKNFDGIRLSGEILISDNQPFDVITPAVTSDDKKGICLAWSVWKANFRFLSFREIKNEVLDSIRTIQTLEAKELPGYTNAWYPSVGIDSENVLWGAWNQHYPASMGICAGDLSGMPSPVTSLGATMDESENGGYPDVLTDREGKRWVFWESSGWDVLSDKTQSIRASWFDTGSHRWSVPSVITVDSMTLMNQTPDAAVDREGRIWLVWSGRPASPGSQWGLYVTFFNGTSWSMPRRITDDLIPARSPKIAIGENDMIWIAFHSGVGESMKIGVIALDPRKL